MDIKLKFEQEHILLEQYSISMNFIQDTCNQIVMPNKLKYSQMDLGYSVLSCGRRYDFDVRNNESQLLKSSIYIPKQIHPSKICVMYLHSMNGSRLQSQSYVQTILQRGYYMASFDFSGCGNSEGNCISFGANEKYDVAAVIQEIMVKYGISRFILWGRSMGAVACLKYCEMLMTNYNMAEIHGIILDSPFQSLKTLIIQLGSQRVELPKLFIHGFYYLIKSTLQKKGKFDVEDLQLKKSIKNIEGTPILFLVSKDDKTIDSSHSQNLFTAYQHWDKKLVYITGLHNQSRDDEYMKHVMNFIDQKASGVNHNKKALRYKRVQLEQQILKNNIVQGFQKKGQCDCNIFKFRG